MALPLRRLRNLLPEEEQDPRLLRLLPDNAVDDTAQQPAVSPSLPRIQSDPDRLPDGGFRRPIVQSLPQVDAPQDVTDPSIAIPTKLRRTEDLPDAPAAPEYKAKHDVGHRIIAGLKTMGHVAPQLLADPLSAPVVFGMGAADPNKPYKLRRHEQLGRQREQQTYDLGVQKEQAQIDNLGMVPVSVPDGRGGYVTTQVQKGKQAGVLQGNERTRISGERQTEQTRRTEAYISHLNGLPAKAQAEAARKIWMSGVADGQDDLKADLAKRMGLTEDLPDTDKGTVKTDANGNFTVVHSRSGESNTVTDSETGKPTGSFAQTQLTSQNVRAKAHEAASNARTALLAGNKKESERLDRLAKAAEIHGDLLAGKELMNSSDPETKQKGAAIVQQATGKLKGYPEYSQDGENAGPSQFESPVTQPASVNTDLMPGKGKFDRARYVKVYQRMHKGKQPSQAEVEDAETRWTNP